MPQVTWTARKTLSCRLAGTCDSKCQEAFALAVGSEYIGNDMPGSPITAATPAECEESCYLRPACLAFTFIGVNGALRSSVHICL